MGDFSNIKIELQVLLDRAETLDWHYEVWEEDNGRTYVEFSKYSPLGEDFVMIINFDKDNQAETLIKELDEYSDDFNVTEHAKMWIENAGKNGVPNDLIALVQDANDIDQMICELYDSLYDLYATNKKEFAIEKILTAMDSRDFEAYDILIQHFDGFPNFDCWIVEHIFDMWKNSSDKKVVEEMFCEFARVTFDNFLKECIAEIEIEEKNEERK